MKLKKKTYIIGASIEKQTKNVTTQNIHLRMLSELNYKRNVSKTTKIAFMLL